MQIQLKSKPYLHLSSGVSFSRAFRREEQPWDLLQLAMEEVGPPPEATLQYRQPAKVRKEREIYEAQLVDAAARLILKLEHTGEFDFH